ncbi:hypothetical protein GBAR_LOCUS26142 [Geodia barretti]|uniref:Uncharacterized protein n=1 Tax=Geodia barretti TaxID=519541 RepID=A0AA35XCG9_GEOBA|nr:hypothetical protein GBAR_LOCUS26142 [Geodia barretti]
MSDGLLLALPKGRICPRAYAAAGARRHRAGGRVRGRRRAPAPLLHLGPGARADPGAQPRRRHLRRLRRGPARRRRQRRADGVRLPRDLCAARPRHRPLPHGGGGAGGARDRGRSFALESRAGRHQPFRRPRGPGRMHQAQRRHGAGTWARALPAHRRSGGHGRDSPGQRPGSRSSISPTSPPGSWSTAPRSRPGPASSRPGSSASARQ